MGSWNLTGRIQCSDDDKKECMELLEEVINLSKKSRKYGILSLESEIKICSDDILKKGVQLLVDGFKKEDIKEIMETYMFSDDLNGKELLKRIITVKGILLIQRDTDPIVVLEKLAAYFGAGYYSKIEKHFKMDEDGVNEKILRYFDQLKDGQEVPAKFLKFEDEFKKLSDDFIKKIVPWLDFNDIVNIFTGTSGAARVRLLKNISRSGVLKIMNEVPLMNELDYDTVHKSQEKFLEVMNKLSTIVV